MSILNILDLPGLALDCILDNLPLRDLMHIDKVCKSWSGCLKNSALKRRKQLVIVNTSDDLEDLKIPSFSKSKLFQFVKENDGKPYHLLNHSLDKHALIIQNDLMVQATIKATQLMPNIKILRLALNDVNFDVHLMCTVFLETYKDKLVSLTLNFNLADSYANIKLYHSQFLHDYYACIFAVFCIFLNRIHTLTRLEWNARFPFELNDNELKNNNDLAATIGRVSSLNIYLGFFEPETAKVLKQIIEASGSLKALVCRNFKHEYLEDRIDNGAASITVPCAALALQEAYLRVLPTDPIDDLKISAVTSFTRQYPNLIELELSTWCNEVFRLLPALSPPNGTGCQSLVHLKVDGIVFSQFDNPNFLAEPLPVFSSVKMLSLENVTLSHHSDFQLLHLGTVFPNVQVVDLRQNYFGCSECDALDQQHSVVRTMENCLKKSRLTFAALEKLTKLEVEYDITRTTTDFSMFCNRQWSFSKEDLGKDTYF